MRLLTVQGVNLEARHLLGQDGLGQVEQRRVVDGEVVVVTVQHPDGRSLDTGHKTEREVIVCLDIISLLYARAI